MRKAVLSLGVFSLQVKTSWNLIYIFFLIKPQSAVSLFIEKRTEKIEDEALAKWQNIPLNESSAWSISRFTGKDWSTECTRAGFQSPEPSDFQRGWANPLWRKSIPDLPTWKKCCELALRRLPPCYGIFLSHWRSVCGSAVSPAWSSRNRHKLSFY